MRYPRGYTGREFFKSIGVTQNIIIAESAASGLTMEGFDNYGYTKLCPPKHRLKAK